MWKRGSVDLTGKKKVSINVEVADDGGFQIELSSGFLHKQRKIAETVDSLLAKVSTFLKEELGT